MNLAYGGAGAPSQSGATAASSCIESSTASDLLGKTVVHSACRHAGIAVNVTSVVRAPGDDPAGIIRCWGSVFLAPQPGGNSAGSALAAAGLRAG